MHINIKCSNGSTVSVEAELSWTAGTLTLRHLELHEAGLAYIGHYYFRWLLPFTLRSGSIKELVIHLPSALRALLREPTAHAKGFERSRATLRIRHWSVTLSLAATPHDWHRQANWAFYADVGCPNAAGAAAKADRPRQVCR